MTEIILMSDPRVAAIPVRESGEPLVDVREVLLVDDRKHRDSHGAEVHVRRGVLERLLAAQALLPEGLRLLFVEGYRTPALQRRYFERYVGELRAGHPEWPSQRVRTAASRYVSPPRSPRTAPARPSTSPSLALTDMSSTSAPR